MDNGNVNCGNNVMANMLKHFNADREWQQGRTAESSQGTATTPFRSAKHSQDSDATFHEFLVPQDTALHMPNLPLNIDDIHSDLPPPQSQIPDPWALEFSSFNTVSQSEWCEPQQRSDVNGREWQKQFIQFYPPHLEKQGLAAALRGHHIVRTEPSASCMATDDCWERQFAAVAINSSGSWAAPITEHFEPFDVPATTTDRADAEFDDWVDDRSIPAKRHDVYEPDLGEYVFAAANPYLGDPASLVDRSDIPSSSEVALALEAAVQLPPAHGSLDDMSTSHTWMQLGMLHSQNENYTAAVQALKHSRHAPLRTKMQLALCYSSLELYPAAYHVLEQWIAEAYPALVTKQPLPAEPFLLHRRVMDAFLAAARLAPAGDAMDADVQIALAILSAGSGELEKAADCFRAALSLKNNATLWQHLGIALASDGKPEEAIEAYSCALELDPSYVGARHRLGMSCITIGCYKEAAEHVLTALAMYSQKPSKDDQTAAMLWNTLEKALSMMGMHALAQEAKPGYDLLMFRGIFDI